MTDRLAPDELFGCTTADGAISVVGGVTTRLAREIAERHAMSAAAAVAAGRLATGAALMGAGLKDGERLSLQIACDGPLSSLAADVSLVEPGTVGARAYAKHPQVEPPRNALGAVDVRRAIGAGYLQVVKSLQIGQPFTGIVPLRTGEIDDDIAAYFTQSQQIPGVVVLGVVERDGAIVAAGGAIAQVMPGADEAVFARLERRAKTMPDVARLLEEGATAADLARAVLDEGAPLRGEHRVELRFRCRCSRERVEAALMSLGRDDLRRLAREQPTTEAVCEFCRHVYALSADEVDELAAKI